MSKTCSQKEKSRFEICAKYEKKIIGSVRDSTDYASTYFCRSLC